jgi:hypothetical protein
MSENQTERSLRDEDAVRDDPAIMEIPHGVASGVPAPLYERADVGIRILGIAGIVVLGLVVVALLGIRGLTALFYRSPESQPQGGSPIETIVPPEAVQIRVDPASAWQRYRATTDAQLSGYGWTDQAAGAARIPITRAMTLITEGVLPVAAPPTPGGPVTPGVTVTPTPGGG